MRTTCEHCRQTFTAERSSARFCSLRCRVAAHRGRRVGGVLTTESLLAERERLLAERERAVRIANRLHRKRLAAIERALKARGLSQLSLGLSAPSAKRKRQASFGWR